MEMVMKESSSSKSKREAQEDDDDKVVFSSCRYRCCRPRLLYFSIFVWISITGGRFLAPFLEHEARMSSELIGVCLASQSAILTILGSFGGSYADKQEDRYPGSGRAYVMTIGILIGSVCIILHAVVTSKYLLFDDGKVCLLLHFVLRMIYAASTALIFPVLDGMTIDFLEKHPNHTTDDYGKERLYGAISWAITNIAFAPLLDRFGFVVVYPLTVFATTTVLITIYYYVIQCQIQQEETLTILRQSNLGEEKNVSSSSSSTTTTTCLSTIEEKETLNNDDEDDNQEEEERPKKVHMIGLFRLLAGSAYGSAFLLCLFCLSQGQAVVDSLIFLFFEFLGSSFTMMGLTVLLTVAFEIPIFHIAPSLLDRFDSASLLLLACGCYVLRVVGYTMIPKGHMHYVLLLEPLHGITYACSQTAAVDVAARSMPPGYEATGQGLVCLVRGAGSILGLCFGGWAVDQLGPRVMYRSSACIVLFGAFVLVVVIYFFGHRPSWSEALIPQEDHDDSENNETTYAPKKSGVDDTKGIELTLTNLTVDF